MLDSASHTQTASAAAALELLPEESAVGANGELIIGGVGVEALAREYGTPLHVIDEVGLRRQMRRFVEGLASRWPNSEVLFASKSFPAVALYAIAAAEGLSIDVAGGGELELALAAGVSPQRIYMHGNAKSEAELQMALAAGVGTLIVDNFDEIELLERLVNRPLSVLVRVIPGVDARTHASQATGGNDSKFGLPLDQARQAVERLNANQFITCEGVHVHIGSQILESEPFGEAIAKIAPIGEFPVYDVGGGLGVRYTFDEHPSSVDEYLDAICSAASKALPSGAKILIEPGRSVVARAGVTLYSVLSVKNTGKNFVAVDGGLADQLDVALTQQRYEAFAANRMNESWNQHVQVVGRQCESGDLLVSDAPMPVMHRGDLVVMPVTGAYSYTMSNNYNGALKPAVVFVANGRHRLGVRRETYADLLKTHQPALTADWESLPE